MATETLPIDRINKSFQELKTLKTLIDNSFLLFQSISNHFSSLEKSLSDRSRSLSLSLSLHESQSIQTLESLTLRKSSLAQRESSLAALITDRRNSAIKNPQSNSSTNLKDILRCHCRQMDSSGLLRSMSNRREEIEALKISEALDESVDASRLVLDVVEGFVNDGGLWRNALRGCFIEGFVWFGGEEEGGGFVWCEGEGGDFGGELEEGLCGGGRDRGFGFADFSADCGFVWFGFEV